jgi:hypothetical protein
MVHTDYRGEYCVACMVVATPGETLHLSHSHCRPPGRTGDTSTCSGHEGHAVGWLIAARSSPLQALRGLTRRLRRRGILVFVISRCSHDRPNVLTLSCKPPHVPTSRAARRLPRLTTTSAEANAAAVTPCSSSRPRRLGRRANGPAAWQLERAVSPL